ncbi:MAG TPA: endo-1,4-beta-xylanase [Geminicoccaceae bacterium]|nr:endo-1,4-beta-xylanase [Geminicoccus sp.]HMU51637.1 endo-1,4-beta-xylanase [Geminicoccaceae bacterium]
MTGWSRRAALRGSVAMAATFGASCVPGEGFGQKLRDAECGAGAEGLADQPPIAAVASRQGRWFGTAVKDPLFTDMPFQQLVLEQCNMLVCTYSMKWEFLQPQPGRFDFRLADRYVDFAERHGMPIRGHTLVWDHAVPGWLGEAIRQDGLATLERHVRGVAAHYAGRIHSWDVVNEAVWPADGRADRLKVTPLLEAIGPSYIDAAFLAAREADPKALLYYNCNPAPYGRRNDRAHFEGVVALLEGLKSRDVPVQGAGLQSHLSAALDDDFDEKTLAWFFQRVTDLGLEAMVTELDVTDKGVAADFELRDRRVAATYRRFLDVALSFPAVKGVLVWGLTDRYGGLDRWPRPDGWAVRGLPFDACMQPKPARDAIVEAFLAHDAKRP